MKLSNRHTSWVGYSVLAVCVAVADAFSGILISFWVLYLLPIALGAWNLGPKAGTWLAVFSMLLLSATALLLGHPYENPWHLVWAYSSRAVAYAVVVFLIRALRHREVERLYSPQDSGRSTF